MSPDHLAPARVCELNHSSAPSFCPNNEWNLPKQFNCTPYQYDCPVVEAILDYAKANLVMFNIFIKVTEGLSICDRI
jgi:hypothetical protein